MSTIIDFFTHGETLAFTVFSIFIISGAIFMINYNKVVHMVISLAFTFLSLAGLYILLEAEFVAVVQILIYGGAITILMIFGIMMTNHKNEEEQPKRPWHNGLLLLGTVGLLAILFFAIRSTTFPAQQDVHLAENNTLEIGKLLYNQYVIPFELVSVLLTVAFIGAIIIAKREGD